MTSMRPFLLAQQCFKVSQRSKTLPQNHDLKRPALPHGNYLQGELTNLELPACTRTWDTSQETCDLADTLLYLVKAQAKGCVVPTTGGMGAILCQWPGAPLRLPAFRGHSRPKRMSAEVSLHRKHLIYLFWLKSYPGKMLGEKELSMWSVSPCAQSRPEGALCAGIYSSQAVTGTLL